MAPVQTISAKERIAEALRLHQQGRLAEAERVYRDVLADDPTNADALHLLGVLRGQQGDLPGAIALIERAIAANPRFSAYHNNLGNVRKRAADFAAAEQAYRRAIKLDGTNADAHLNLGKLLAESGNRVQARACYIKALRLAPRSVETQMSLGRLEEEELHGAAAIARYREAARLAPSDPAPHLMLGRALTGAGELDAAETSLCRALALDPGSGDACYNLGVLEQQRERFPEAAAHYRRAIELATIDSPESTADSWNNLGVVLSRLGEREAALAAYLRAAELQPRFDGAFHNLGKEALKLGAEKAAEKYLRRALELNPQNALAWHDLGALQQAQGLLEEASEAYRRAVSLPPTSGGASFELRTNLEGLLALQGDAGAVARLGELVAERPDYAEARFNWSTALLLHEQYETGWREYESRREVDWLRHNFPPRAQPMWDGSPLDGRTLLLSAEQGFGDTLQSVRYLPLVTEKGGRVIIEVQPALRRLLEGLPGVSQCIAQGEAPPAFDVHLPLMSLPHVFATTIDTIPAPLAPVIPPARARETGCRVGLVWAGNPGHSRDRLRSLSLEVLKPLARVPGVTFVSLQTGPAAAQMAGFGEPFHFAEDCSGVRDFRDTAEIIAGLHLVISIDSAVAHLAASLGKPVWMLLANVPDWRWGFAGTTTPWYPTITLYRQAAPGAWAPLVAEIATHLSSFPPL
jgi:tetratricopeptide (TPR) repeat protein